MTTPELSAHRIDTSVRSRDYSAARFMPLEVALIAMIETGELGTVGFDLAGYQPDFTIIKTLDETTDSVRMENRGRIGKEQNITAGMLDRRSSAAAFPPL